MTLRVSIRRLILVPALLTFAVTGLRLVGEIAGWSPRFFSRDAGGAAALVGIVWLVPVFGAYFAVKLVHAGERPSVGRTLGWAVLGLLAVVAGGFVARAAGLRGPAAIATFGAASIVGTLIAARGWPALERVLVAYGLAARVPVAAVMLVALLAKWGTHYEKGPPGFPEMGVLATWFWIGLVPQLTLWIAFTAIIGAIAGGLAAAFALRGREMAAA